MPLAFDRLFKTVPELDRADNRAGITFVNIDSETGKLGGPNCPHVFGEAFIAGTEPTELASCK